MNYWVIGYPVLFFFPVEMNCIRIALELEYPFSLNLINLPVLQDNEGEKSADSMYTMILRG